MRMKVKWWQFTLALMMNKQITEPVSDKQMNCFVLNEIAALFLSSSVFALFTSTEYADDDKRYHLQINNVAILQQLDIPRSPEISRSFLWLLSAIVYWFFEWQWNLALEKLCQSPAKPFMERTVPLYHIDRIQSAVVWSRLLKAD